ncbi:MAG: tRNA (adenosine(37)-N6)-threonylcarbamoyltransferase complex ATPase subunit type 1 TsaE [Planctomycetota bacterium]
MSTWTTRLADARATHELGESLGRSAMPGSVVALVGDLGAGKTTLVTGMASGLDIPCTERVRSPSYFLLNSYRGGRLLLDHFDAYFMERPADLVENGFLDFLAAGHVIVIEWADRFADLLPEDHLELRLDFDGDGRRARLAAGGERSAIVLSLVAQHRGAWGGELDGNAASFAP